MNWRKHTALAAALMLGLSSSAAYSQSASNVTIVLLEAPQVIEPCESALYGVGIIIKQNVTETLTERDLTNGAVVPRLATGWERIDDKTWRFKLPEGVNFHDGSDIDAKAAAYSIERTMDPALQCMTRNKFFTPGTFQPKVVDAHTLDVVTEPAQPILPILLSSLAMVSPNTPKGQASTKPIGTGPYVLDSFEQGEKVDLKRFDGYWGTKPAIEKATYVFRDDSAVAAAMVATGEADIAPSIAVQDATNPKTDFSYPNGETTRIRIGTDQAPLDDKRVREALNYAVDRNAFIGSILSKDVVPAAQLVVSGTNGYNPALKPLPYDLDKAKSLIEEAKKAGVPVDKEIRMVGRQNLFPNVNEVLEALVQMWQAAGLNVKLQMVERSQALQLGTKPYAADRPPTLITDQHNNDLGDTSFTVIYKYSSSGPQSDSNVPELDRIISAATAADGQKRTDLFQQAFKSIAEDVVPDVMLFHMAGYARVSPRINFRPSIATNSELQLAKITFNQ